MFKQSTYSTNICTPYSDESENTQVQLDVFVSQMTR
jgi:hypothetical protein